MAPLLGQLLPRFILRFAERLRFPQLFLLAAGLFLLDLLIPDLIPFADEILLALVTLILAALRRRDEAPVARSEAGRPPIAGKAVRID